MIVSPLEIHLVVSRIPPFVMGRPTLGPGKTSFCTVSFEAALLSGVHGKPLV
ncbi:hypothetical protein TcasGA2_TC032235 [Tribolium castaneum]|uniref:Uncharacterized protein n=1 Tax=Tribolium castaneum TaxID=7070 RepID=A0A139WN81_TRICA|nr:hypothetical protein TcasGA2_TC032235 [Tribolium castaneum]